MGLVLFLSSNHSNYRGEKNMEAQENNDIFQCYLLSHNGLEMTSLVYKILLNYMDSLFLFS